MIKCLQPDPNILIFHYLNPLALSKREPANNAGSILMFFT